MRTWVLAGDAGCRIDGGRAGAGRRRGRDVVSTVVPALPRRRRRRRRSSSDRRSTGSTAARPARSRASIIPTPSRAPASPGTRRRSRNTSQIRCRRFPAPAWPSPASRTTRRSTTLGLSQAVRRGRQEEVVSARWAAAAATPRPVARLEPSGAARRCLCARDRCARSSSHGQGRRRQPDRRTPAGLRGRLRDLARQQRSARISSASASSTSR